MFTPPQHFSIPSPINIKFLEITLTLSLLLLLGLENKEELLLVLLYLTAERKKSLKLRGTRMKW